MKHAEIAVHDGELTPQFLSDEEKALFAEALLGQEAIAFLDSDLGRVLRGMAIQRREDAKEAMLSVSPDDEREIRRCQFEAAVAGQFLGFIQEVLTTSEAAEQALHAIREQV